MDKNLTSNPNAEKLDEVTVMGRTVYVSQQSGDAYVEFQDELVSMTNLRAWNYLMEQAKKQALDGYEDERSLSEKELQRSKDKAASDLREMADEIYEHARKIRSAPEGGASE